MTCVSRQTDEDFINENNRLVHYVVRKYYAHRLVSIEANNGLTYEDLFQLGCIGLLQAKRTFDPNKGKFSTFAVSHIWGTISSEVRGNRLVQVPRVIVDTRVQIIKMQLENKSPEEISTILHKPVEVIKHSLSNNDTALSLEYKISDEGDSPIFLEDVLEDKEAFKDLNESLDSIILKEFLGTLSPREGLVVQYLFYDGLSQRETGDILKLSQAHVSRISKQILKKASEYGEKIKANQLV